MPETELENAIILVTGAALRAEEMDRPLAYRLGAEIARRLGEGSGWRPLVVTDVLYLNDKRIAARPTISIGGPGVNSLSARLFRALPAALAVDNTLIIQMDVEFKDLRCCLWGMDHPQTVTALEVFMDRYLAAFLEAATGRPPAGTG